MRLLEDQPGLIAPEVLAEAEAGAMTDSDAPGRSFGFENLARGRASWLVALLRIDKLHARFDRAAGRSLWLLCIVFALLGAGAAAQGFDLTQQTVNFFWLLVVLLGVHTVALLFWLLALAGRKWAVGIRSTPMLQMVALWLVRKWSHYFTHDLATSSERHARHVTAPLATSSVGSSWARLQSRGALGFWNFSVLSHSIWAAYLTGGLVMTLILLSLRQYDFEWATTLLSSGAFEQMTFWLSELPRLIGVAVPDAQLVQLSRAGVEVSPAVADTSRVLWSNLLLASLIIWGLLPRVVLLVVSLAGRANALRRIEPDLASPYFVALRQRLLTGFQPGGIIDPDDRRASRHRVDQAPLVSGNLPASYDIAAIYVDPGLSWPPAWLQAQSNLGCIDDAASEKAVITAASQTTSPALVLCAHLSTVPDRGVRRIVQGLQKSFRGRLYLGLLMPEDYPVDTHRLEDWYRLAAAVGIALDDIAQLPIPSASESASAGGSSNG